MTHDGNNGSEADRLLDPFFAAARGTRSDLGDDLLARIIADAADEMRVPIPAPAPRSLARNLWQGFGARILATVGGWGGLGGLATAALAGVWIGFAAPGPLYALTEQVLGTEEETTVVDLMPEFDDFLTEG